MDMDMLSTNDYSYFVFVRLECRKNRTTSLVIEQKWRSKVCTMNMRYRQSTVEFSACMKLFVEYLRNVCLFIFIAVSGVSNNLLCSMQAICTRINCDN